MKIESQFHIRASGHYQIAITVDFEGWFTSVGRFESERDRNAQIHAATITEGRISKKLHQK